MPTCSRCGSSRKHLFFWGKHVVCRKCKEASQAKADEQQQNGTGYGRYLVKVSDLANAELPDRVVESRVNREAARRRVKELNAESVQTAGPRAPLYYCERAECKE